MELYSLWTANIFSMPSDHEVIQLFEFLLHTQTQIFSQEWYSKQFQMLYINQSGIMSMINWLIDYLWFYVPLKNFALIWRRHHCRWRTAKFRPMLGAQGLWAGRDLYRATPAVTRDLGCSGLIRRTVPFSRLLQHTRGCGGSILT
jgi:hypothetical protein